MTINMLFEALRDGRVTMDTTFAVSSKAKGMGGSTMFLQETDRPTVNELIHGMIVNSGNDACVVVGRRAGRHGRGLCRPDDGTRQGAGHDGLYLRQCQRLAGPEPPHVDARPWHPGAAADRGVPEYYTIFAETEFNYQDRAPDNRFNRTPC